MRNHSTIEQLILNSKIRASNLYEEDKYDKAEEILMEVLSFNPFDDEAIFLLGLTKYKQNHLNVGTTLIQKAINLNPQNPKYIFYLGGIYFQAQLFNEAEKCYLKAIEIDNKYFFAYNCLGAIYHIIKDLEKSKAMFRKSLELNSDDETARYFLSLLEGNSQDSKAPETYVKNLFDGYSSNFEMHLTKRLQYKIPNKIANVITSLDFPSEKLEVKILDLGCGTGLIAQELCNAKLNYPINITGIDISSKMIEKAASKKIYNKLKVAEVTSFLKETKKQYDIITAADVLVYIGDLEEFFKYSNMKLKSSGYIIFSIESLNDNDKDFYIGPETARYMHNKNYIERLASNNNMSIVSITNEIIRTERGADVPGCLYTLRTNK